MHCDTREVALSEQLVQFRGSNRALDEDDDLVELECVKQIVELSILLRLAELDVVLLQPVQGKLGLIVDVDLQRVLHEFLADRTNLLRERGAEHHDLFLCRRRAEDLLHVSAHVCECGQQLIRRTRSCMPASVLVPI